MAAKKVMTQAETEFLAYWRSIRDELRSQGREDVMCAQGKARAFHNCHYEPRTAAYQLITEADKA